MSRPEVFCKEGGVAEDIFLHTASLQKRYTPTPWAPNGHAQSFLAMLRGVSARGTYTRQEVLTDDGGTLGLDWWNGAGRRGWGAEDAPVLLIVHGINGGSHEGYCKWACISAATRGWRPVVLNLRGCNGLPLTSARGYNAILTSDVALAVASVAGRFPLAPVLAAGYSLGSVLLAKYVAEADWGLHADVLAGRGGGGGSEGGGGSGSGLVAAALVSPPVCIHATNAKLSKIGPDFVYNLALAYKLREYIATHAASMRAHGGTHAEARELLGAWTTAKFDDVVTTRHLGYAAPADYYRHACSTNYLPHVRTPTLVLAARDDPFLGVLPVEAVRGNPFTGLVATRHGGHLGFLSGMWPLGPSYSDALVSDLLASALQLWRATPGRSWDARAAAAGLAGRDRAPYVSAALAHAQCSCVPPPPVVVVVGNATAAAAAATAAAAVSLASADAAGDGGRTALPARRSRFMSRL